MSLTRKLLKVFGIDGAESNFAQFGSRSAGAPTETKDIELIQNLNAWLNGLQSTFLPGQTRPFLEDLNGFMHVLGYQVAYLLQDGIPEWNSATEYRTGSMCRKAGTAEIYSSRTEANVGNALPVQDDNTHWAYVNPKPEPVGKISEYAGDVAPFGYLICDGAAISRAAYPNLFAVCGDKFGAGDGITTFNLPDLKGRTPVGAGNGSGLTSRTIAAKIGAETHVHAIPHKHKTPIIENTPGSGIGNQGSVASGALAGKTGNPGEAFIHTFAGTTNVNSGQGFQFLLTGDTETPNSGPGTLIQPSLVLNFIIKY